MPVVYLIEGPVGAGKSTHAKALASRTKGVHMALDEWFAMLFSADRPPGGFAPAWYVERKQRLLELMWKHARAVLASGTDAILELGLVRSVARREFCDAVRSGGFDLVIHVLDAPRDVRGARVRQRNIDKGATFSMVVPEEVFELASEMWEAPDEVECEENRVEFITAS